MSERALADVLPLSPAQEGLLYHAQLDHDGPDPYLVQCRFRIEGCVDATALRRAVDGLLARHPNLRACFRHGGLDRPVQVIPERVCVPWAEADLTGYGPDEQDAELERLMAAEVSRRFDVSRPPLLRCTLARRGPGRAELLLTVHHILLDGWSMPVLTHELGELYAGHGAGLPAAPPYRAYLAWLNSLDGDAAARAWSATLAGAPATLLAPRSAAGPQRPATLEFALPGDLSDTVRGRAREYGVTLNTIIRAAWGLVLARMTGADDVVFGTVASCRPAELAGVEAIVGLLANMLPVRVRLRRGERTGELLGRLQREYLHLMPHENARLSDVRRHIGARELFDSVLAVQNFPHAGLAVTGTGLMLAEVRDATHYPLTLSVVTAGRLSLRLDYRPEQVSREVAEALGARVSRALELLAVAPDGPADQLEILPEAERRRLLTASRGMDRPPLEDTIPGQLAAWVARTPDATAVVSDGCELTYAELEARADDLAQRLAGAGVRRETPVALLAPRSPELVIAQLAVLKAGGCCVPLDPGQPAARLRSLVRRAGARVLVSSGEPGWTADGMSVVSTTPAATGTAPRDELPAPLPAPLPDTAAYLLYTSGSTGEPKGVVLTHRSVVELAAERRFRCGRRRRVLLHSPHTFDASLYELWVTLLTGSTVVLAPPGPVEPSAIEEVARRHRVTDAWLTAELFRTVADLRPGALAGLTEVWTGGDVVAPDAVRRVLDHCPRTTVVNGYGPTEATTFATCHVVTPGPDTSAPGSSAPVPVGRPLGNTRAYVLDARLRLAAAGTVGELYLSGTGLARGYAGQPALTAGRFVAVPFAGEPGARMYRTGDLARWTARGDLEFAGRADRQLKIRGHRAEPAEIESVLERCQGVTRAVVTAQPGPDGGQRLVASLALEPGTDLTRIRRHAAALLPAPLVPAVYVPVGTVPLTWHGKVDRTALAASEYREPPARAPRGPLEESLCELFTEVLDVPAAGPDTDFFDAGGHSLLAMRLVAAIEALTRTRLSISALLESPTPAALAERLDGSPVDAALGLAHLITLRPAGRRAPLFCLHEGLGLAWSYAALLRHLPDRPLYGLQSPVFGGNSPEPASIEELAELHLAQIRAVQPAGPYLLLGASFGGLLAYQLAVRLRQEGERLRLVALLDAVPHLAFNEVSELAPDVVEQAALVAVLGDEVLAPAAASGRLSRAAVFPAVRDGDGPLRGSDDRWLAILTDVCASHIRMATRYQAPAYDGSVTLCTAKTEGLGTAAKVAAWRRTAAGVRCHELDCAHGHILRPAPAAEVSSFLAPELEES